MLRSGPFTRDGNRQASAVDEEMKACAPWNAPKPEVEVLATTGQRRVIRRPKVESQQHEERREKARCLTEREMEEKTQRQGGLDREAEYFRCAPRVPAPSGSQAAMAAGDNQMVMSPRQTRARSEAAQFWTWYFILYVGWTLDFIHPVWSAPSQPHSGFVHQRPRSPAPCRTNKNLPRTSQLSSVPCGVTV